MTFSFGVASLEPSSLYVPDDLVRQADLALYRAKATGRDRIELAIS